MNRFCILILLCLAVGQKKVCAIGAGAVITLEFPSGAENTGMGETGVSIANTLSSVFWNPANVACLYQELSVNYVYTSFHEVLLPEFHLPELYHDYTAFSVLLEDMLPQIDIGYAYFRNYVNMGYHTWMDSLGRETGGSNSNETVTSNTIAFRAFDILSIGASFKKYDSRLAPGIGGVEFPHDGVSTGNAIDLGIRLNKKIDVYGLMYINPSIGIATLNFGNDSAQYIHTSDIKDPLVKKGIIGAACEVNLLEIIGYTYVYEIDYDLLTKPNARIKHSGHKLQLSPFYSRLNGTLTDTAGERFEKTSGYVLTFNFRRTLSMVSGILKVYDIINKTDLHTHFNRWDNSLTCYGFDFKPNIHISKSHSSISGAREDQGRTGQTRDDWSIGVGLIAGFPPIRWKKKNTPDIIEQMEPEQSVVVEEEDGELIGK